MTGLHRNSHLILWTAILLGCGDTGGKAQPPSPIDLTPIDGAVPRKGPSIPEVTSVGEPPTPENLDAGTNAEAALDAGDAALEDAALEDAALGLNANFYWDATVP